jgi:hypothetical protein
MSQRLIVGSSLSENRIEIAHRKSPFAQVSCPIAGGVSNGNGTLEFSFERDQTIALPLLKFLLL